MREVVKWIIVYLITIMKISEEILKILLIYIRISEQL